MPNQDYNDEFAAPSLNGLFSDPYRDYALEFDESEESVDRCADELARWCRDVAEPWFGRLRKPRRLLKSKDSPLGEREKHALEVAVEGGGDEDRARASRMILGVTD